MRAPWWAIPSAMHIYRLKCSTEQSKNTLGISVLSKGQRLQLNSFLKGFFLHFIERLLNVKYKYRLRSRSQISAHLPCNKNPVTSHRVMFPMEFCFSDPTKIAFVNAQKQNITRKCWSLSCLEPRYGKLGRFYTLYGYGRQCIWAHSD